MPISQKQKERIRKEFIVEWRKGKINTTTEIIDWWETTIDQILEEKCEEIRQIVIEDVPHRYQGHLLAILKGETK